MNSIEVATAMSILSYEITVMLQDLHLSNNQCQLM